VNPAVEAVLGAFRIPGSFQAAERWGSGHINETYRITTRVGEKPHRTLLQRINHHVFAEPRMVTESIRRATDHVRGKLAARGVTDLDRRVLTLLDTRDGDVCHHHRPDDTWWRAYAFVNEARSFDVATSPAMAREAAHAFGAFQRDLADLPLPRLPETIPHFHDTPRRFAAFEAAVAANEAGRVEGARDEIAFVRDRASMAHVLLNAHEAGEIPERVTHNDTKINNVLFDDASHEAICVIDLDTVMPGLGLYDFGDMVRTTTSPTPEDEQDLARIHADPRLFEALALGYWEAMGDLLTQRERELLPFSGRLITLQIGMRFLTDHLQGDPYFRTHRPGHNRDRARAQFALLRSLESQDDAFSQVVSALPGEEGRGRGTRNDP
jgi:hypothetical protein